jgi:hypothetical protein
MTARLSELEASAGARSAARNGTLPPETAAFYQAMIEALDSSGVPFLVGGAYALARYTGIERHTKDFDIFVSERDVARTMAVLAGAGCATQLTFPHWLGKAFWGADFIDVIFSSGNGLVAVDEQWFAHGVEENVLGRCVRLIPPEEMLWSKAFVMERERYDGADINHLLRATGATLAWPRLLGRFGDHWPVLLSHLVLFTYVYPAEARCVPRWVMDDLLGRAARALAAPPTGERMCLGPFISRAQYLIDIEEWGYRDLRLTINGGPMSRVEVQHWTDAIDTID